MDERLSRRAHMIVRDHVMQQHRNDNSETPPDGARRQACALGDAVDNSSSTKAVFDRARVGGLSLSLRPLLNHASHSIPLQ